MKPIDVLTGGAHSRAIAKNLCVWCRGPALTFDDDLSRREYQISGMCQACQDQTFNRQEERD